MSPQHVGWLWLFLALACGILLEAWDQSSIHTPSTISDASGLPLPARVVMEGVVKGLRTSGSSWVFELEHNGIITCYFRHPPPTLVLFANTPIRVRARLEQTPKGRLCVVEEVISYSVA